MGVDCRITQVSLAVNPDIRLFEDGTDPDDVRKGVFADSWLLSALSMISAATIGDGGVDEQVHGFEKTRSEAIFLVNIYIYISIKRSQLRSLSPMIPTRTNKPTDQRVFFLNFQS